MRGIFYQFWELLRIGIVYIISYSEKFLDVVVGATEQNGCNSNNIVLRQLGNIWSTTLLPNDLRNFYLPQE